MNHDELLNILWWRFKNADDAFGDAMTDWGKCPETFAEASESYALKALRAVVELHKPTTYGTCSVCLDSPLADSSDYPCETIQAIEEELK